MLGTVNAENHTDNRMVMHRQSNLQFKTYVNIAMEAEQLLATASDLLPLIA
jgi:hypothetical protein